MYELIIERRDDDQKEGYGAKYPKHNNNKENMTLLYAFLQNRKEECKERLTKKVRNKPT